MPSQHDEGGHDPGRPLALAVYGIVDEHGGSVASADSVVLRHLLDRGHSVDFYAFEGYVNPTELAGLPRYRYFPVAVPALKPGWRLMEGLPGRLRGAGMTSYSQLSNLFHERAVARAIASAHRARPYDALLTLGLLAPFRVAALPGVSWPQGPPQSEWRTLRTLWRGPLRRYFRPTLIATLSALYRYKEWLSRSQVGHSDRVICGSRWAADEWRAFGVPADSVTPIPYPFDLSAFAPAPRDDESPRVTRFLWLGRIVPRKRLDLALEAFKRLRAERPDVELLVIGQFSYAGGFRKLLDEYADVPGWSYRPSIHRAEVPALFRTIDAVLQPGEAENLGSTALEAQACGLPSIVGPSNGTIDYLGSSSIVFDAFTPDSIKLAMSRMIDALGPGPARPAEIAADCRAAAERWLSVDGVVRQVEDVLRGVMPVDARAGGE